MSLCLFFFNDTATTEIYTLSLHDALPISAPPRCMPPGLRAAARAAPTRRRSHRRSEEHTSELQSQSNLVCRLLLEKKKQCCTISKPAGLPVVRQAHLYPGSVPCLSIGDRT